MSRLEKTLQKKSKGRKLRFMSKILFILLMSINLLLCVFIINKNAKDMLGEDDYNISYFINEIHAFINEKVAYMNEITKEILAQVKK